jgi:hypothetical protein
MNNAYTDELAHESLPNQRFLSLVHLKTRSVCSSRVEEWRAGQRWRFREVADEHGTLDGTAFEAMVEMPSDAAQPQRTQPCVGHPPPKPPAPSSRSGASKRAASAGGTASRPAGRSASRPTRASARDRAPAGGDLVHEASTPPAPTCSTDDDTPRWTHDRELTKWTS